MISAGLRNDSVRDFRIREGEHRVGCTADLERAGFLKIFTFEENARAGERIQRRIGEYRGAMNSGRDARVSFHDRGPRRRDKILTIAG
jgi:hypothetical protein